MDKILAALIPFGLGMFFWFVSDFMGKKVSESYGMFFKNKSFLKSIYITSKVFVRFGSLILIGIGLVILFRAKNINF